MPMLPSSTSPPARRPGLGPLRLLVLALLLAAPGCRDRGPAAEPLHPRHVFLITVDTLRADHLGTYGYPRDTSPHLDRWAEEGAVFERAIAQWPKTGPSFASMFTGLYPLTTGLTHHAAVPLPEGYLSLAELFKLHGFTTLGVVSNGVLSTELGWSAGFDEYLETWEHFPLASDDMRDYRETMNALRVNELALPLLERHRDAPRLFVWIHYSDPHTPYILPTGEENPFLGDRFYAEAGPEGDRPVRVDQPQVTLFDGREDLKFYVAQYDANVRVVDRAVRELLDRVEELGLGEDTCYVFTADHGESLGEHGYYLAHGRLPYNNATRVPLVVVESYRPQPALRVAPPVDLVDLYPTLRDLVAPGFEVPGLEGKSLRLFLLGRGQELTARQEEVFRFGYSQAGGGSPLTHFRSVQGRRWKLVYHPAREARRGPLPPRWELYDLEGDPLESRDLLAEVYPGPGGDGLDRLPLEGEADDAGDLRRALMEWMDGRDWIHSPEGLTVEHSEQTLRTLRALGYIN